jgi:hypothetical protein
VTEAAAGFWSYVHADNDGDANRIVKLAQHVRDAFALQTGAELELFLDRDTLVWGDAWRERIDQAIAGTTFFIPIVTPRYFQSAECRRELVKFTSEARRLGLEELLLPVYYVAVPELESDPDDEAMELIAERQREDFRGIRLLDQTSSAYRQGVSRLATRLAEIAADVVDRPQSAAGSGTTGTDEAQDDDDQPGVLDRLAEGEAAFPRWTETLEKLAAEIVRVGELAEQGSVEMEAADARGTGLAGRIAVTDRIARRLEEPANNIARLGQDLASDLVKIDPAILTLLEEVERAPGELDDAAEFLQSMHSLRAESREPLQHLNDLVDTLTETARLSRALRPPLGRMKRGLRGALDADAVIEEWDRRALELEERHRGEPVPDGQDGTPP